MSKKNKMLIILGACITALSIFLMVERCFAEIPENEVSLGGISGQSNRTKVMQIYGKPTWSSDSWYSWRYGNSVFISFDEGMVGSITVTANNGWATPAGLTVGMNINTALRLYGDPDKSVTKGSKTLYVYFVNLINRGAGHLGVVFDTSSRKITKLNVKKSHMADFKEYYPGWEKSMLK